MYDERLHVPLRWWVQSTMFLATVWLAFIVALPAWLAWAGTVALSAAVFAMFGYIGAVRIQVRDSTLYAGQAHIDIRLLGLVEPLDVEQTRRVHGVQADARAFLMTRPYLKRSVKATLNDPADPTPYWLISTRHPDQLAAALRHEQAQIG